MAADANGMMRALALLLLAAPVTASAEDVVGRDHTTGLPWSVVAPADAGWRLDCRFRPAVLEMSNYDRRHWANRFMREGRGPQRGALPTDNGRCNLTLTAGRGPIGLALVKDGKAQAAGTNDPARPANVTIF
jgi:hypothetical protein